MNLTEFLLERIAEDEEIARRLMRDLESQIADGGIAVDELGAVTPSRMLAAELGAKYRGQSRWDNVARGQYVSTLADPTRVLAECEAKRRAVQAWIAADEAAGAYSGTDAGIEMGLALAIEMIALPYSGHPDYQQEWRP